MITVIQFKSLPGRRFEVLDAASGPSPNGYACRSPSYMDCALMGLPSCTRAGAWSVCETGKVFREIKE